MQTRAPLLVPAICALTACVPSEPQAKLSLADADTICTQQANRFGRTPLLVPDENGTIQVGLQAEMPDDLMVQRYYRQCVKAKSGISTKKRVEWRL